MADRTFRMFHIKDVIAIIVFAGLWLISSLLITRYSGPQAAYISSLFVAVLLVSFVILLLGKSGSATLFFLIGGLLTSGLGDLGAKGIDKIVVLVIAGAVLELSIMLINLRTDNIHLSVVVGATIAAAAIPLTTGLILSFEIVSTMIIPLVNLILLSLLIGLAGSSIALLSWHYLRIKKVFLRFEFIR